MIISFSCSQEKKETTDNTIKNIDSSLVNQIDSSKVKKNDVFFAIKGNKVDGNNYIDLAIRKGAKVIVSEKKKIKKKDKIVFLYSSNVR